jgi:hypothetical protein
MRFEQVHAEGVVGFDRDELTLAASQDVTASHEYLTDGGTGEAQEEHFLSWL